MVTIESEIENIIVTHNNFAKNFIFFIGDISSPCTWRSPYEPICVTSALTAWYCRPYSAPLHSPGLHAHHAPLNSSISSTSTPCPPVRCRAHILMRVTPRASLTHSNYDAIVLCHISHVLPCSRRNHEHAGSFVANDVCQHPEDRRCSSRHTQAKATCPSWLC